MIVVTLTRAIGEIEIDIPIDKITGVEDGPHGGAVVIMGAQRIGVVETRAVVRARIKEVEQWSQRS